MKRPKTTTPSRLNHSEKIVLHALGAMKGPTTQTRLVNLLHLADLSHELIHGETFGLDWFIKSNEYKSKKLSEAIKSLERKRLVKVHTVQGARTGIEALTVLGYIKHEVMLSIKAYCNESVRGKSYKAIDKEANRLYARIREQERGPVRSKPSVR